MASLVCMRRSLVAFQYVILTASKYRNVECSAEFDNGTVGEIRCRRDNHGHADIGEAIEMRFKKRAFPGAHQDLAREAGTGHARLGDDYDFI
jgi:hypothetical protein